MYDITMQHVNRFGRVSLCGCISLYNENFQEVEGTSDIKPMSLGASKGKFLRYLIWNLDQYKSDWLSA